MTAEHDEIEPYELQLLRASVVIPFFDTRALPSLGERLIERGVESSALMALAIMATEPFDPRDAHQAAAQAVEELGCRPMTTAEASDVFLAAIAQAVLGSAASERDATSLAWRVYVASNYTAQGTLTQLGYLDDAWDAGWAGPNDEIAKQVQSLLRRVLANEPGRGDIDTSLLRSLMPLRGVPTRGEVAPEASG